MEDTKNSKSQPIATDPKKGPIIELTPAQEVRGVVRGKVIDLVHVHPSPKPAGIVVAPTISAPADGGVPTEPARAPEKADHPDPQASVGEEPLSGAPESLDGIVSELELSLDDSDTPDPPDLLNADENIETIELTDAVLPAEPGARAVGPQGGSPVEDEDPIIELTQILDPAPSADLAAVPRHDADDEILELTDIVDPAELSKPPKVAPAVSTIEDEIPIIELTDAVDAVSTDALDPGDDGESILELTDTVNPQPVETEPFSVSAATDKMDDGPVELTEVVALSGSEGIADPLRRVLVEPLQPAESSFESIALESASSDITRPENGPSESVIRLDNVLKAHKQRLAEQVTQQLGAEMAADQDGEEDRKGLELENSDQWSARSIELTDNALQKAVEQVIRTQYARRIEEIIASTVERVVTREMESIRNSLMLDGEPEA